MSVTGIISGVLGKDGGVKYWDGDTWENILSLKGHHGEVWAMVQNSRGDWIASAGRDKSIRIWSRTDEQVFLEEEREKEVEELYEEGLVEGLERSRIDEAGEGEGMEVTQAGKQTVETLNAGRKNSRGFRVRKRRSCVDERLRKAIESPAQNCSSNAQSDFHGSWGNKCREVCALCYRRKSNLPIYKMLYWFFRSSMSKF